MMLAIGGGALLLAGGISYVFATRMVRPLLNMKDVTMQLAGGHYEARVQDNPADEIGTLARSINELGKRLKHHEDMRSEFLANVTHELRTPLSYIRGYSQVLEQGLVTDDAEKDKYLRLIMRESQRMQRLVNDLSEQAELGSEGFQFVMERIDLRELITATCEKLVPIAGEKQIEITFYSVPPTAVPAYVLGDRDRLEQALINILQNAIRYTGEGGRIVVMMHCSDREIEVQVKDSGIGIPPRELPHIFERFYRVEKSRNREKGGLGLGLSIVKQIFDKHGGQVRVESEVGVGTVFYFTLPVAQRKK
jgi:signal transduction histidine kinase